MGLAYRFFDSGAGSSITEEDWTHAFRRYAPGVVLDSYYGTMEVTADGSAMQVSVAAGEVGVGGHWLVSDAVETVTIGPASGSTRHDLVVVRANRAANTITLAVVAGTPGAGVPPTPTKTLETHEIALASVEVLSSDVAIAAARVTDRREVAYGIDGYGGSEILLGNSSPTGVGTVTFNKIPKSFNGLRLAITARSTHSDQTTGLRFRYNGDSTTYYNNVELLDYEDDSFVVSVMDAAQGILGDIPAATVGAGQFGQGEVEIAGCFNPATFTMSRADFGFWGVHTTIQSDASKTEWRKLDIVNSVTVFVVAGNFLAGSSIRLYGRR